MHMSFWFSSDLGDFLFDGLKVVTSAAFAVTCLVLFLLALGVEGLKMFRAHRSSKSYVAFTDVRHRNNGSETSALLSGLHLRGRVEKICLILSDVLLYLTQDSINWIVMLAVMGYNGYIFLSVLAGAGLGYAFFGESIAHSNIESIKMQLQSKICGECQVKEENEPGLSDPPIQSMPESSRTVSEVTVHFMAASEGSVPMDSQMSIPD